MTGGRFRSNIGLRPFGFRHRFRQGYPYAYPLLYDWGYDNDYGYGGYDYAYPPVVQPPAPQMIVEPAPTPVRSEIHEYQPAPEVLPAAPAAPAEAATFVIALNDGSRLSANAVWVQDKMLHYIDPDDRHQQISMRSVDRQSTRRINRERKLDLWLPAAQ